MKKKLHNLMTKPQIYIIGVIIILFIIFFINHFSLTGFAISEKEFSCKEFQEDILWILNYSYSTEGSTNYRTWYPVHNCTELNVSKCFLENISIETRFLYFGSDNEKGEGYIQISNLDKTDCNNPELGIYGKYIAYESIVGEGKKSGQYCGDNQNENSKCGVQISDKYNQNCYGIKIYGSQYMLVDAFKINYKLCSSTGGEK